ncbi:MAG: hypothetical protein JW966_00605 [Anaerolineae bacterium]|nr:hypothetical protein [Anaerolineae bacterium]
MYSPVVREYHSNPTAWGAVPAITLGLLVITIAVLAGPWPSDPALSMGYTVSHYDRMRGESDQTLPGLEDDKPFAWYGRRVFDGMIYGLLALGYGCTGLIILRDERYAEPVLIGIGSIGLVYGALVGLYLGPILTLGGSALIVCSAGLDWLSGISAGI